MGKIIKDSKDMDTYNLDQEGSCVETADLTAVEYLEEVTERILQANYYDAIGVLDAQAGEDSDAVRKGVNGLLGYVSYREMQKNVYTCIVERYLKKEDVCNGSAEIEAYAVTIHDYLKGELKDRMNGHNSEYVRSWLDYFPTPKIIAGKFCKAATGVMKSRGFPYFLLYITIVTCFDFGCGRGESYIIDYLYDEKDIQQIEEMVLQLDGKNAFAEIKKMVRDLLKGNDSECRENLHNIMRRRSTIFNVYMITMKALKRLGFKSLANVKHCEFIRDAVPYLYDSFKPHQEVDVLVTRYQCVMIMLDALVNDRNYEWQNKEGLLGKSRDPIEKAFAKIYEEFLRHFEPEKLLAQNHINERMRGKKRCIYKHFSQALKEINDEKLPWERLKDPDIKSVENYHFIMIMVLMLSKKYISTGIFYLFCDYIANRYICRSSEIGLNTHEIYVSNYLASVTVGAYNRFLAGAAERVWEDFLEIELPSNVEESQLYGIIYQQLWDWLINPDYYSEESVNLSDVIIMIDDEWKLALYQ